MDKIEGLEERLGKLTQLPNQHALLLLRQSLQQDLRHLQRTLYTEDLQHLWKRLDKSIWDAARRIWGARDPDISPQDIPSSPFRSALGVLAFSLTNNVSLLPLLLLPKPPTSFLHHSLDHLYPLYPSLTPTTLTASFPNDLAVLLSSTHQETHSACSAHRVWTSISN